MKGNDNQAYKGFTSFEEFFQQAEERPEYWIERAKLEFTREMLVRMEQLGVTRTELAKRLDVQPGLVTRLASGNNNFTLETMVRIALALGSIYRAHLQPHGQQTSMSFGKPKPANPAKARTHVSTTK
jgi:hypothetical protein